MLYGMFRLGIGFIIAIVLFVLIKYTKTIDKRKCCIAAFIAVSITVSLLYLIPFENAFTWDVQSVRNGLVMAEILGPCLAQRD